MDTFAIQIQDGVTIFLGIIVGALPFVLLGVVVSALIGVFIKPESILKLVPKNKYLGIFSACFLGVLMPVCECGNIPVARRLIERGVSPHIAMTFLVAAPVMNPIVLLATWAAFQDRPDIVWLRFIFTFILAYSIGFIFSFQKTPEKLLGNAIKPHGNLSSSPTWGNFRKTTVREFFEMMSALTIGAFLASATQVFISRSVILGIGQGPLLSILAMILFGFIISVCANVDAFIALSYANSFTGGSILAFLVFGPVIDIKALFMLKKIFNWKTIIHISMITLLVTTALSLAYNLHFN